jgi:anti-anti-sigma regulatory factor
MVEGNEKTHPRVVFTRDGEPPLQERLRKELIKPAVEAVTLDLGEVTYLDPRSLTVLAAAGGQARTAGKPLFIDRVSIPVYKALQLAKLATLFRRVHNG